MIKGTFKRNQQGELVSFELSGHANAGPYGSDIVCAAVSALSFSAVNGIEALGKYTPIVSMDNDNEGYLYCETITEISAEQHHVTQLLLENLLLGLQGIEEEHNDVIQVITVAKK